MQVTNTFQNLNTYQQPVIQPIELPDYTNKEIYDASQENIIRGDDGKLTLTPQGELNLANKEQEKIDEAATKTQEQKDELRGLAVDYLEVNSKKSQVEIYLAVATDGAYSSNDQTATIISELRDVQKQNNAVQAYATYKEAQDGVAPKLY